MASRARRPRAVRPLEGPRSEIGGKAAGLALAGQAGVAIPEAFVIPVAVYSQALRRAGGPWSLPSGEPWPTLRRARAGLGRLALGRDLTEALHQATQSEERWSLRSSATVEDRADLSCAGVFTSVVGVDRGKLDMAIRRIWASVWSDAAYAYLRAHGVEPADVGMAVLVHPTLRGRTGTVFTADPAAPQLGELLLETASGGRGRTLRIPRRNPKRAGPLEPVVRVCLALERALSQGPLDIEWVLPRKRATPTVLQQRPVPLQPPSPFDNAPRRGTWRLDGDHNPDPLSPAQQGLVQRVAHVGGVRQCVVDGYLFFTVAPTRSHKRAADSLGELYARELAPAMEAILAPLEAKVPSLRTALIAYERIYQLYTGRLAPTLWQPGAALERFVLRARGDAATAAALLAGTRTEMTERNQALWMGDLDTFIRRWGAFAPIWDVASPTYEERPPRMRPGSSPSPESRRVRAARRADALRNRLARALNARQKEKFARLILAAQTAHQIAQADDLYFARAQRLVRRALLLRGPSPDIFFVPLGQPFDAAKAQANRALWERQRALVPPDRFRDGRPEWEHPLSTRSLHGLGTRGRARGTVGQGPGNVLVLASVLPQTVAPLLGAVALVTDHGGLLSHGATLARELGIPAVLGTAHATRVLKKGDVVVVDADRGEVYKVAAD